MGKIKACFLCFIFSLFFWGPSFSEVVTLKSGTKVEGKIVEQTDKYIKLLVDGEEVAYLNDELASIAPAQGAQPMPATKSTPALPQFMGYQEMLKSTSKSQVKSNENPPKVISPPDQEAVNPAPQAESSDISSMPEEQTGPVQTQNSEPEDSVAMPISSTSKMSSGY